MKICPNCNYENFSNPNFCEGCGQDLHLVRPEFFTIVNFIKKNSEVYAVFGILIALFQYFFTSQDSNVKIISLFPLFISGYLLLSLLIKADQIVDTQSFENSYNRYFNENSFEFWIFLSINLAFFVGLILSTGPNYYLPIFLLGIVTIFLIIFSRKITYITKTNHQELLTFSTRLNLLAISLGEISFIVFQLLSNLIKQLTDPTIYIVTIMIPIIIFFFGIGTVIANMVISQYMLGTEMKQIVDNRIVYSIEKIKIDLSSFVQTISNNRWNQIILVIDILLLAVIIVNYFYGILPRLGLFLMCL